MATLGPYQDTYTDSGLSAFTRYYYQVVATNSVGTSSPSNTATVTTPPPEPAARAARRRGRGHDPGPQPAARPESRGHRRAGDRGLGQLRGGVDTVFGSGADIGNTADQSNFVDQTMTGDGTIMAQVTGQQATPPAARSGAKAAPSPAGPRTSPASFVAPPAARFVADASAGRPKPGRTTSTVLDELAKGLLS